MVYSKRIPDFRCPLQCFEWRSGSSPSSRGSCPLLRAFSSPPTFATDIVTSREDTKVVAVLDVETKATKVVW